LSLFAIRVAMPALLGAVAVGLAVLALASITAHGAGYPDWRRIVQAPIAAAAVLAFGLAAYRVRARKPSAHIAAGGCVLTSAFGVAAFS
jgi:hypothetical protein